MKSIYSWVSIFFLLSVAPARQLGDSMNIRFERMTPWCGNFRPSDDANLEPCHYNARTYILSDATASPQIHLDRRDEGGHHKTEVSPLPLCRPVRGMGQCRLPSFMRPRVLILVLLFLLNGATAYAFTGEVVGVLSGDTIEILHNEKGQRVRLYGIDCPVKGQPYGNIAKEMLIMLTYALDVTLQTRDQDHYGRIRADVMLADKTNVNQKLVKEGLCWWDRQHAPKNTILEALETEARSDHRGLWVDPSPVPPREWRKLGK